ncbi:MAG: geranylgeranylglyceryl/heptaprenylglyceryl phosphate synthase [Thermoplasmatota archaeon]
MNLFNELLSQNKKLHFSLIDPDKQTFEEAGKRAETCAQYGTNAIMIGGTTVKDRETVYNTIQAIKKNTNIPTILFPNSADMLSKNADYIFFMKLLNSKEDKYQILEQMKGAPLVKKWNIIPIPTAYLVISTSKKPTTVEKNVKLHKIGIDDITKAVQYSVYAEMSGMHCIYLEAGSDAEQPVSTEMIKAIRGEIKIPIIVGGGIKNPDIAKEKTQAGADIIVNGTATEENIKIIKNIIQSIQS